MSEVQVPDWIPEDLREFYRKTYTNPKNYADAQAMPDDVRQDFVYYCLDQKRMPRGYQLAAGMPIPPKLVDEAFTDPDFIIPFEILPTLADRFDFSPEQRQKIYSDRLGEDLAAKVWAKSDDPAPTAWPALKSLASMAGAVNYSPERTQKIADALATTLPNDRETIRFALQPNIDQPTQQKLLAAHPDNLANAQRGINNYGYNANIHPETFNNLFEGAFNHAITKGIDRTLDVNNLTSSPLISSENIKKVVAQHKDDLLKLGRSRVETGIYNVAQSPTIDPETIHELYQSFQIPTRDVGTSQREQQKADFGRYLVGSQPKTPEHVLNEIVSNPHSDSLGLLVKYLGPNQQRIVLDRVKADTADSSLAALNRHVSDPQLLRELVDFDQKLWNAGEDAEANALAVNPSLTEAMVRDIYDQKEKLGVSFKPSVLIDHPNFPEDKLQQIASRLEPGPDPGGVKYDTWTKAKKVLQDLDPDKHNQEALEIKPEVAKLRVFRDKILQNEPAKGEVTPKELGTGPFQGGWKPVQEKNGNVSAKKLQEFIDSHPSTRYNSGATTWKGIQQRHGNERNTQHVFQLDVSTDQVKKMKAAGVYHTFKSMTQNSADSGHPARQNHTIGWVRYEHHHQSRTEGDKPSALHIDEIQTDLGPNTIAQLKKRRDANPKAFPKELHPENIEKINEIVFGNHHPSDVLLEGFRQHQRDQGNADLPIHLLDAKPKSSLSGMNSEKELPAHLKYTYNQMPKKLGFKPSKYGETVEQDNKALDKQPMWKDTIRKFEEEVINKALSDIPVGAKSFGDPFTHDYNHVLSPAQRQAGYSLDVRHTPDRIVARVNHDSQSGLGDVTGVMNIFDPTKMRIDSSYLGDRHRNKGLGKAMYEALLAHARNAGNVTSVIGDEHSTMASRTHRSIAEKHGLTYSDEPHYGNGALWNTKAEWDKGRVGAYDAKYAPYEYMIKSELKAAFKNKTSGEIKECSTIHDISILPEDEIEDWDDGFIDIDGKYHTITEAVQIKKNEDGVVAMLESDDPTERILALKSAQVQPHHILIAIKDEDPTVRAFAANHQAMNGQLLMAAIRQCLDPQTLEMLLNHPACSDGHLKLALEGGWDGSGAMAADHPANL